MEIYFPTTLLSCFLTCHHTLTRTYFRHPDKSDNPEAESKFVEITQAYNLLSDPERRRKYDQRGITEETQYQDYSQYSNHVFEDIFSHFQGNDIAFFHKLSITSKYVYKLITIIG